MRMRGSLACFVVITCDFYVLTVSIGLRSETDYAHVLFCKQRLACWLSAG